MTATRNVGPYRFGFGRDSTGRSHLWMWNGHYWQIEVHDCQSMDDGLSIKLRGETQDWIEQFDDRLSPAPGLHFELPEVTR